MLINKNKEYFKSTLLLKSNWLEENSDITNEVTLEEKNLIENYYIIDETTLEGKNLMKIYEVNYPFVDFEHDGKFVTKVIVLDDEKKAEDKRVEQEKFEQELIESLIPSKEEVLKAETELQIINILQEADLI